eukprot:TRINITY_DN24222_c0_g1_i2.p1 TRINITY_DN24222_c0_g1~~TRINITY_DN24222_c0_g1_i2.p1  ORF type:complete len:232 (+),score=19.45 TRINITY_DN24222_c0_g1_i2:124-819(+)
MAASFASSADLVFQTRSLRTFLNHPGVQQSGGFVKPMMPDHRPPSEAGRRLLMPFHSASKEDGSCTCSATKKASRQTSLVMQIQRGLKPSSPRSSPPQRRGVSRGSCGPMPLSEVSGPTPEIFIGPPETGGSSPSAMGKRRRPVHDSVSMSLDGDPEKIPFSEEPDDPRVFVPAHRIGDDPPACRPSRSALASLKGRRRECGLLLATSDHALGMWRRSFNFLKVRLTCSCL